MNIGKEFQKFAKSQGISSSNLDRYKKATSSLTPYITEESSSNLAMMDVFSRLMKDRIIFLGTDIDDYVSNVITAQLLFLDSMDNEKDISLYINSGGGEIYSGNSILDVMDFISPEITTICTGLAASMAAVILSNGTKGKRGCLKRSRVMIHQPLGGAGGQATDIEITAREILKLKKELTQTLADNCGQDYEKVVNDCERDYWMNSEEAKAYGIVDKIWSK